MNRIQKIISEPAEIVRDIKYGRMITNSNQTGFKHLIQIALEFVNSCTETNLFPVCTQMAFTLIFALFPTLLFIILICSVFVSNFESMFYSLIQLLLPKASFTYISGEIEYLFGFLNRIGIFILFLSTIMGTISAHTFLAGINQTYGFENYQSKRWEWFKSFIVLLSFVLTLAVFTSLFLYICQVAQAVVSSGESFISLVNIDAAFFDIMLVLGIFIILLAIYVFTPERRIVISEAIPGAIFSTVGILIVFRIYIAILNHSQNYLRIYGSLSGLFILLTAFFFICVILNLGAKVNVFYSFQKYHLEYDKIKR